MDKKYIVGLVFALVLLGSASAVAVQVVLRGKTPVPPKGLVTSASEKTPASQPATSKDFTLTEKTSEPVQFADIPTFVRDLFTSGQRDLRLFKVTFADDRQGFKVERDANKNLAQTYNFWLDNVQSWKMTEHTQTENMATIRAEYDTAVIYVNLQRLTPTTTGELVYAWIR